MTAPTHAAEGDRIARWSLALGLLGVAVGVFVGLGNWSSELAFFDAARVVPYVLGAASMLLAVVSLVVERRYRLGIYAFSTGGAAVLVVPAMGLIVAFVIIAAIVYAFIAYGAQP